VTSELGRLIARRIALAGPIPVADFMAEALGHPRLGYYRKALALGAGGDFTTAPEISQMFGELLGAWLAERWQAIGRPSPCLLVELGPGRGVLLADALRATRAVPGFHAALQIHLVEINETLRELQRTALAAHAPVWHERFDSVPTGPMLLIANEFFDALPVRQFQRTPAGWAERMIGLAADGEALRFALAPGPSPFAALLPPAVEPGAAVELSPAAIGLGTAIGAQLAEYGGWALVIDYGRIGLGFGLGLGFSLQAVRGHRGVDVLDRPGETDLSAHVDFEAIAAAAAGAGARVLGPASQGDFLRHIGIQRRAETLKARATPSQAVAIDAALDRLIAPDQMGTLFRVLALGDTTSVPPAGFSDPPPDAS
jgi:NADH dehydrogenase [ubiquinone] 1 alpha subcomplex assembly factor 7